MYTICSLFYSSKVSMYSSKQSSGLLVMYYKVWRVFLFLATTKSQPSTVSGWAKLMKYGLNGSSSHR